MCVIYTNYIQPKVRSHRPITIFSEKYYCKCLQIVFDLQPCVQPRKLQRWRHRKQQQAFVHSWTWFSKQVSKNSFNQLPSLWIICINLLLSPFPIQLLQQTFCTFLILSFWRQCCLQKQVREIETGMLLFSST